MQGCIKVLGGRCAPKGSHIKTLVVQTIAKALSKRLAELSRLTSKLIIDDNMLITDHNKTLHIAIAIEWLTCLVIVRQELIYFILFK